jgi:hypothetical protein
LLRETLTPVTRVIVEGLHLCTHAAYATIDTCDTRVVVVVEGLHWCTRVIVIVEGLHWCTRVIVEGLHWCTRV